MIYSDARPEAAVCPARIRLHHERTRQRSERTENRITHWKTKRRGRDLNPRNPCGFTGFRDRHDRPLCHLSGRFEDCWASRPVCVRCGSDCGIGVATGTEPYDSVHALRLVSSVRADWTATSQPSSACFRSAIRSSACSSPTETRTVFSVIPAAARAAGVMAAWLMVTGNEISDSTPPRDSATSNS